MNWDILLVFLFAGIIRYISSCLLSFKSISSPSSERSHLLDQITKLKHEAEELNTPSTFAKFSKCQRQIAQLEKKLADFPEASVGSRIKSSLFILV